MVYENPFKQQLDMLLGFLPVDLLIGLFLFLLAVIIFSVKERVLFVVLPVGFIEILIVLAIFIKLYWR